MGDVRIRGLDDDVIARLKAQAARNGRTFGEELRSLLTDAAWRTRREWAERLRAARDQIRSEHGVLPDSTPGIRLWRDGLE